jgi:hypothetical protein
LMFRLVFDPEGDLRAAARACEADVFRSRYGNSDQQMLDEYGPYESASVFVAVADEHEDVVAAARLILPGPAGLKTLVDIGRPPWRADRARTCAAAGLDPSGTWDIATVATRPDSFGGAQVSAALWHGIFHAPKANGAKTVIGILDTRVRRIVACMGIITHDLPEVRQGTYLGSTISVPIYLDQDTMLQEQGYLQSTPHAMIAHGLGLDRVHLPFSAALKRWEAHPDHTKPTSRPPGH